MGDLRGGERSLKDKAGTVAWVVIGMCMVTTYVNLDVVLQLARYESSPVEWCEINYEVHPWVAEWWNTLSSIPIALVGPLGYATKDLIPVKVWHELPNVYLIFVLMVITGVGSMYFHGTLSVFGQVMDELGIVYLILYAAFIVMPENRYSYLVPTAFMGSVLTAFVFTTTLIALFAPTLSHVLVLSCVPFGLYNNISAYKRSNNKAAKARFDKGLRWWSLAWGSWLVDRLACEQMRGLRDVLGFQPQLHAVWHVVISYVAYCLIGVCCEFREEELARAAKSRAVEIV